VTLQREITWDATDPDVLVVACSDGRFQEELDVFLQEHLRITHYDRLYLPGGAGALAPSGIEFTRAAALQKECRFLIEAHGIKRVILIFHGPSPDGPDEAACGDYRREFPEYSATKIRKQQDLDVVELLRANVWQGVKLEILRAEVTRERTVEFVRLHGDEATDWA
jgi:hypothetical protein